MVFVGKARIWWTICWLLIDRIKERQSVISNEYPDQGMFGLDITIFPGGIYVGISFRILSFIVNIDKIIYRIINFFHTRKFCDMIKPSNQFSHSIRFLKSSLHWANRFWRNNRVCEEIKKRCIVVKKSKTVPSLVSGAVYDGLCNGFASVSVFVQFLVPCTTSQQYAFYESLYAGYEHSVCRSWCDDHQHHLFPFPDSGFQHAGNSLGLQNIRNQKQL